MGIAKVGKKFQEVIFIIDDYPIWFLIIVYISAMVQFQHSALYEAVNLLSDNITKSIRQDDQEKSC